MVGATGHERGTGDGVVLQRGVGVEVDARVRLVVQSLAQDAGGAGGASSGDLDVDALRGESCC